MRRSSGAAHDMVSLARAHMGEAVYYAPEIPPRKEAGARRAHALHLPENEPILVLCDNTLFGGADEGFVITPARICWRNGLEHPRQIEWENLDPSSVSVTDGGVQIAGGKALVPSEVATGAAATILALAARFGRPADPYRARTEVPAKPGTPLTVARLVALARRHVGEVDAMFYHPGIPPQKLRNARAEHASHLPEHEEIAVLHDDTLFGSAVDGFLITPERLCAKVFTGEAASARWSTIAPETITTEGSFVHVGELRVQLTAEHALVAPVAALIAAITAEARGDGAR